MRFALEWAGRGLAGNTAGQGKWLQIVPSDWNAPSCCLYGLIHLTHPVTSLVSTCLK